MKKERTWFWLSPHLTLTDLAKAIPATRCAFPFDFRIVVFRYALVIRIGCCRRYVASPGKEMEEQKRPSHFTMGIVLF